MQQGYTIIETLERLHREKRAALDFQIQSEASQGMQCVQSTIDLQELEEIAEDL